MKRRFADLHLSDCVHNSEAGGSRKRDPVSRAATNSHWQRLGAVGNATLSVEQQQTVIGRGWGQS